jgi:HEAT repeat protein
MKSTLAFTIGVIAVAAVAGSAALLLSPQELRLDGRPLADVLQDLNSSSEASREAATTLLRKSAVKVVPVLVEMARVDDAAFTKKMKALAEGGQLDQATLVPPSVRRSQAVNGFRALGAAAASATPALTEMLRDPKTSVAAALALACIGGEAINPLFDTLVDPNPRLAGNARTALESLNSGTAGAAAMLIPRLKDKRPVVRAAAARALGRTGQDAARAVPLLIELLDDPDGEVLLGACAGLGALQSIAKTAVPKLLPFAKQTKDKMLHDVAGIAVWRIDPAEARKAGLDEALIKTPTYTGPAER